MSTIQTTKLCEDNPRLKLTEIGNYKNIDSWGQVGEGEIIDGMLLMIFAFISLFGMTKKKNNQYIRARCCFRVVNFPVTAQGIDSGIRFHTITE